MTTTPTPDLVCPVCRTVNPATRQFCRKCAADLRAPVPDATAPLEAPSRPVPVGPIIIGAAFALAVLLIGIVLLFALGGSPTASPTPGPTASAVPASAVPTIVSAPPSVAPPTAAPTIAPPPTPSAAPASAGSGDPVVDSLKGPGRASCTDDNGTGTEGYIHLEWTSSNTTGVRLSIDPPAPNVAYDYGYDDYPADGSANLPFTCDPPNSDSNGEYHLYVATTVHDGGRFAWRFIRVYIRE